VQDKNFYLFALIERTPAARRMVKEDNAFAGLAAEQNAALDRAVTTCAVDSECYAGAFRWTDSQIETAGRSLAALYDREGPVRSLVDGPLRASGAYIRHADSGGKALLTEAWQECIRGVNRMIDVYGTGKAPRYPAIDSMQYDPKAAGWRRIVQHAAAVVREERDPQDLAYSASLRFALEMMLLNHRDEAGRYEPMESGENAAAFRHAKSVEWSRFPYSVIVVPGSGNDRPGVRLSPNGMLRDEIAARRFRDGKAPFILVSGGHVHPSQTEYSEAIEMKRDLIERLRIPAEAIVVDPHARHTTTNMRNAARLLYRYGFPFERKALVSTDLSQSQYIENPDFAKRCVSELGYIPYRLLGRTSPFDLEFLPLIESLQIDPEDPLDP
jgi:hypothetical protein